MSRAPQVLQKEQKYSFILERIAKIEQILKKRTDYSGDISLLETQIPQGITSQSLAIKKASVDISLTSTSLSAMSTMLENMVKLGETDKRFSKIILHDFSLDTKQGVYTVSLTIQTS